MSEMPEEIFIYKAKDTGGIHLLPDRRHHELPHAVKYVRADAEDPRKCPMSDKCDLAIAYLKGVEDGKDAVRKVSTNLEGAIKQVRDFAEVLDEEGMDRDGLRIAIYAILDEIEGRKR